MASPESIDSYVIIDFAEAVRSNTAWTHKNVDIDDPTDFDRKVNDNVPLKTWADKEWKILHSSKWEGYDLDRKEDEEQRKAFESTQPLLKEDSESSRSRGFTWQDADLLLLPTRVLAFAFRNRKFGKVNEPILEV